MNSQKEVPAIGCGIIGCANGYQYSSIGSDKYFNIANRHLDLVSNIADTLPDPDKRDLSPLFCLSQVEKEGHKILNVAEYHSIKQKGSNRSGTFLGSFIQFVDYQFDPTFSVELFNALKELCSFQYKNFVDHNENRYCSEISGKDFPVPESELQKLANKLLIWNSPVPKQEREVYFSCQSEQQFELLLKLIIETGLLTDFTRIYFSASTEITKGFQKSRVEMLELSFNATEYWFRKYYQEKLNGASQYISQLHNQVTVLKNNIQKEVERESSSYVEKLKQTESELASLANKNKELELFAEFGKSVSQLKEFNFSGNKLEERFGAIESKLGSISSLINHLIDNKPNTAGNEQSKSNAVPVIFALFFGFLSVLLLGIIIWSTFSEPSDDVITGSKKYKDIYTKKQKLEQDLQQQVRLNSTSNINERIETEKRTLISDICSSNSEKFRKDIDYQGRKLCQE